MSSLLSFTGKRWNLRRSGETTDIVSLLRSERGLMDATSKLSDPFLFPHMAKAVSRIERAVAARETIGIFGDYDADGITGTAQLVRYFRRHGVEPISYLPHRAKEGYGLKNVSIDALAAKGVTLLITVDTGIGAKNEIAYAKTLGIDTIVTDHHHLHGDAPKAHAILHPKIPAVFPNEYLSGSGIAFMLVRALERGDIWEGIDIDISLATIGTIGDLVPLTGENRILVTHGMKFLAKLPPSPLKDLIESVAKGAPLTAGDIAFRVVPRINAAGRMASPEIALEALLVGGEAIEKLNVLNAERQSFVLDLHERLGVTAGKDDLFLVIGSTDVTPGTAGLIASRLSEQFGRPSLVASITGDTAVASLRSIPEIDLMEYLGHPTVSPLLRNFGGHRQAAGCSFRASDLGTLKQALCALLRARGFRSEQLLPTIALDAELECPLVTLSLARSLSSLAPFGAGNSEPLFLIQNQVLSDVRLVGSEGTHLQCRVGGTKGIAFRFGEYATQLSGPVDLACRIGINSWQGRETVQVVIEDIRRSR